MLREHCEDRNPRGTPESDGCFSAARLPQEL